MFRRVCTAGLFSLLFLLFLKPFAHADSAHTELESSKSKSSKPFPWEFVSDADHIKVWRREVKGTSLVKFRGQTVFDVPYKKILSVFHNDERRKIWTARCVENYNIRDISPYVSRFYNRTGSSFPFISDRDVVMETRLSIHPDQRIVRIALQSVADPAAPPKKGCVRMPNVEGVYILEVLTPSRTRVTYEIHADPGGSIANWIVNLVGKSMPRTTLQNLRKELALEHVYDKDLKYIETTFNWAPLDTALASVSGASLSPDTLK